VLIEELTTKASLDFLTRARLGRLACAQGPQPYIVPFYFAYHHNFMYGFSSAGQKIEWMRANPLVCMEADEVVSTQEWTSVIVVGRYEELPDTLEWRSERELAWRLLRQYTTWWEPGYAKTMVHGTERFLTPVFYRIEIIQITGRRAVPDSVVSTDTKLSMIDVGEGGRLERMLRRVLCKLRR
jgi:uncharacterized protein